MSAVTAGWNVLAISAAGRSEVRVDLTWAPAAALEIVLTITQPGRPLVLWIVGRDMLADGLTGPAGKYDITIPPSGRDEIAVVLQPPSGRASLLLPRAGVAAFLAATEDAVPRGTEVIGFPDFVPDWMSPEGAP